VQKTKKKYWNNIWNQKNDFKLLDYSNRINIKIIEKISIYIKNKNISFLEIGCALSQWLPFFAVEYKANIYGMDYSLTGIKKTIEHYKKHNIKCTFINKDFRHENEILHNKFDIIFSFGVIEHFSNTCEIIKTISKFLKKDGIIISIIPNLQKKSIYHILQNILGKKILYKHCFINAEQLVKIHSPKFKKLNCSYIGNFNFQLLNFNHINGFPNISLRYFLALLNKIYAYFINFESPFFSPYIIYIGKKHD